MSRVRLIAAAALLTLASHATASSFIATTDNLGASLANSSGASSDSSFAKDKRIIAAQDDAVSFVASNGQIRGAHLEAALKLLRSHPSNQQLSDLQLAQAIIAR